MSTIAEDLITAAKTYTADTVASAIGAMSGAAAVLNSITTAPEVSAPSLAIKSPTPTAVGTPTPYSGARFEVVKFDGVRPETQAIPILTLPDAPGTAPSILPYEDPTKPTGEPNAELLNNVPTVNDNLKVPDAKDLLAAANMIPVPPLIDVVIPPAPTLEMPEFEGTTPTAPPPPPTNLDQLMRTQYETMVPVMRNAVLVELDTFMDREFPDARGNLAKITARLNTYLAGGSALTPEIETAIYNRTLDKTNADGMRANRKAWGEAARAGHLVPSAILLSQLQDIDQERRNNNARAAIDIAIKQAELEQSNLQFAVTQSSNLYQIAINASVAYYNGLITINGQAIQFAREVVDAVVKAYQVAAEYARVQALVFEAQARVYEAKIRAAMAVIEAYVAEVRGLEAQSNVNLAKVAAYKARLEALQSEAMVYRAAIDGVMAAAGLEKLKVEIYTARVQGYGAQVNAFSARYVGYEAAIRGQVAKMQASSEQVRAFVAQVQAYSETVRAKSIEIDALARAKEAAIRAYAVDVEAYAALNRAQAEAVQAEIGSYNVTLQAFIAKSDAEAKHSMAEISSYEAGQRSLIAAAELHLRNLTEVNKVHLARAEGLARVAVSAGEVWSAQAQASLSGQNTLAAEITQLTG